jgi:hypothetical protein
MAETQSPVFLSIRRKDEGITGRCCVKRFGGRVELFGGRTTAALPLTARAAWTATWSAGTSRSAGATLRHFGQTLSLFVGEDLCQPCVDVLLQGVEVSPLLVGQFELILQEGRQDLPGSHSTAAGRATKAAGATRSAAKSAGTSTGATSSSGGLGTGFLREHRGGFVARYDSVFVGICPREESL